MAPLGIRNEVTLVSKRLFWLLFIIPHGLLVVFSVDYVAEFDEGLFNFTRRVFSLTTVFASLPYVFKRESIYNYYWFLGYFAVAILDEWPTYLMRFSWDASFFIVAAILFINFVLLYKCLSSIKRTGNKPELERP